MLLDGGLRWQEMSLSPKDMDFLEARHAASRDVAQAFGVPPQLLGIPGDNTYSNYQEARLALWDGKWRDMIRGLLDVAAQPDPIGEITKNWRRPNGLSARYTASRWESDAVRVPKPRQ